MADEQSLEDRYGLEGNDAVEADATDPDGGDDDGDGDAGAADLNNDQLAAIASETDRLLGLENVDDNLTILEKNEEQAAAARAAAAKDEPPAGGDDAAATGADLQKDEGAAAEDASKGAAAAAKEGEEGGEDDDPAGAGDDDVPSVEDAQSYLEYLTQHHADNLLFSFKANGEEQKVPLSKLKEFAAGYMGQGKVQEVLDEAKRLKAEAEAQAGPLRTENETLKGKMNTLLSAIDDPAKFQEFVLEYAEDPVAYMRDLVDTLETTIAQAERNPDAFRLTRTVERLTKTVSELKTGSSAKASEAPAGDAQQRQERGGVPADFGFTPGEGYPREFASAAYTALEAAASAVGKSAEWVKENVIEPWKKEGRKEPVLEVFKRANSAERADEPKHDAARKPPIPQRQRNQTGTREAKPTRSKSGGSGWDSIEQDVAAAVRAGQRGGRV